MTCEHCKEEHEGQHVCPFDHQTILLIITRPTRVKHGETPPEDYQLDIDRPTGRFVLTGTSDKIFEGTFAVQVGKEQFLDVFTEEVREAMKTILDKALTNGLAGGKI